MCRPVSGTCTFLAGVPQVFRRRGRKLICFGISPLAESESSEGGLDTKFEWDLKGGERASIGNGFATDEFRPSTKLNT